MRKQYQPSLEELTNDSSLRWTAYRTWELLWSDDHQTELRFVRYENFQVRLATLHGMVELPDLVPAVSVRRPATETQQAKVIVHAH